MLRDRCPYCGLPQVALSRFDPWSREIVRDIRRHDCPAWAEQPALPSGPTDVSFIREARNTAEGLAAYRRGIK